MDAPHKRRQSDWEPHQRRRLWLILAAVIVAVIILAAFISLRRGEVPVRAARVVRGTIISAISTNGKVQPLQSFEAHAPTPTTVKRLAVREGDRVRHGQLLLELDDSDARAQAARALAQLRAAQADINAVQRGGTQEEVLTTQSQLIKARSELQAARRNLDAMRRLQQEGAASLGEVNDAENQLEKAKAEVRLLEQKQTDRYSRPEVEKVQAEASEAQAAYAAARDVLNQSVVRSPIDGMVYSVAVHQGDYVSAGQLLAQVANLTTVQVVAFVDEPDIGRLALAQTVDVSWDALPGRVWHGSVSRVPAAVKMLGTRNVGEIACSVDNRDLKLLPNINVGVKIIAAEHRDALILPREALRRDGNQHYVFEIVNGQLRRAEVRTSLSNLTQAEVEGISPGTRVALGSMTLQSLRNGLPVRIVQ